MSRRLFRSLYVLTLSSFALQGCRPCYEDLFVRGEATGGFTVTDVTRSGATPVALFATLEQAQGKRSYDVIARNERNSGDTFMVTFHGFETPPTDRIAVTLAIPIDAAAGDVYKISRAFTAPERGSWGFRSALPADQVEIGFSRSQYISPGEYSFHYVARAASGEIRVVRRLSGTLEVVIDAVVSAGSGLTYRVVGPILVTTGSRGEVCPSIT